MAQKKFPVKYEELQNNIKYIYFIISCFTFSMAPLRNLII